jgi:hypothetical protein
VQVTADPIRATIGVQQEDLAMTDPTPSTTTPTTDKPADHVEGAAAAGPTADPTRKSNADAVSGIFASFRDALDDLAERATPTVREVGARTAEIAALAADKAAPAVKKAGDVASDASSKLAARSRDWAAEVRASMPTEAGKGPGAATAAAGATDAVETAAATVKDAATDVAEAATDAADHAAG